MEEISVFPRGLTPFQRLLLLRKMKGGTSELKTISGSIIHITDALERKAKSLVVDIDPVQSGSGDPAPDNIRPITGFTECNVFVQDEYDASGEPTVSITFPAEAGTVYGGTLDVLTGVLTVTHKSLALDSITFSYSSTYSAFYYQGEEISDVATKVDSVKYCSCYKPSDVGASSLADYSIAGYYHAAGTTHRIYLKDSRAEGNATTLKTLLSGQMCVYDLATPLAYQLTPQQVTLLQGENYIWADTGDIELQYYTEVTP